MKLALFTNPTSDKPYVGDELTEKYCADRVRTSEWVDVEFPVLSLEARQVQLARIAAAREEVRKHYDSSVARLDAQEKALQA